VAEESLELFKELDSPVQQYKMHKLLSDIYKARGNYQGAYTQFVQYEHLKDSITAEEQKLKMVDVETEYQKEINRIEIQELEEKSALKARRDRIENYILVGLVIIVLAFALMFYSRTRTKKRINDTLREKNEIIQYSLEEKEVLLREIHHRVQNNLQFVSSLLNLQGRGIKDEYTLNVLKDCKQRIQSMALIHQKLYQENSLKDIDFKSYVDNLVGSLKQSYEIDDHKVKVDLDISGAQLGINAAIPIGLILNELITNAFKYAFQDDQEGHLSISLNEEAGQLILIVQDNGEGMPADFDMETTMSFGLKLVRSLSKKLKGDLRVETNAGTKVTLKINDYKNI
jgi:two-component sensor histidine kinase